MRAAAAAAHDDDDAAADDAIHYIEANSLVNYFSSQNQKAIASFLFSSCVVIQTLCPLIQDPP